jgi:hypothetical protein
MTEAATAALAAGSLGSQKQQLQGLLLMSITGPCREHLLGFEGPWQAGVQVQVQLEQLKEIEQQLDQQSQLPAEWQDEFQQELLQKLWVSEYAELGRLHAELEQQCMAALRSSSSADLSGRDAVAAAAVLAMAFGSLVRRKDGGLRKLGPKHAGLLGRLLVVRSLKQQGSPVGRSPSTAGAGGGGCALGRVKELLWNAEALAHAAAAAATRVAVEAIIEAAAAVLAEEGDLEQELEESF